MVIRANQVDRAGLAEVWRGPFDRGEIYHQQLFNKG